MVTLLVSGPGIVPRSGGISTPTSHVDLIPTLLGLAGIDREEAAAVIQATHSEVHPLPGRDLSGLLTAQASEAEVARPIYFMSEDDVSHGSQQINLFSGKPYEAVQQPSNIESVITTLPSGPSGAEEIWKLNRYYESRDTGGEPLSPESGTVFELHNLSTNPEERANHADEHAEVLAQLQALLVSERQSKRRLPSRRHRDSVDDPLGVERAMAVAEPPTLPTGEHRIGPLLLPGLGALFTKPYGAVAPADP